MDRDVPSPRNRTTHNSSAEKTAGNDVVSARRRKLIRASAAAVPAIMTLRSGSAAAVASLHGCIERDAAMAQLLEEKDNVYGDGSDELTHDQWARVVGKAGMKVTITHGNSDSATDYYCLKNTTSTQNWEDIEGWDCFHDNGNQVSQVDSNAIKNRWDTAEKLKYYSLNKTTGWEHINEFGHDMIPPPPSKIPFGDGRDVYLLLYVASAYGEISGATYYPRVAAVNDVMASPITDSCLCSVDPNGNILGLG